jgi:hypothetical protein
MVLRECGGKALERAVTQGYASGGLVKGKCIRVGECPSDYILAIRKCDGCGRNIYVRQGRWCSHCASTDPQD